MKVRIIELLKGRYPERVSGEEISRLLGISRTAVWKHIHKLIESGYEIESHSKVGYRLISCPDKPYEHELTRLLKSEVIGSKVVYHESVSSTNELAREMAGRMADDGTVVVAEEQTAGKGRMGRSWFSPAGRGLWFSVILRPSISPVDAPKITLMAAVAVAETIRQFTGIAAGIKWPNDILVDGRKVCGILTEMNAEIDKVNFVILGIGVNVNFKKEFVPEGLKEIAVSLAEHKEGAVSRLELLAGILNNLDDRYRMFLNGRFAAVLSAWKEMSVTLNRQVRVQSLNASEEGLAVDIDGDGALLLKVEDGSLKRILAGEVSLR